MKSEFSPTELIKLHKPTSEGVIVPLFTHKRFTSYLIWKPSGLYLWISNYLTGYQVGQVVTGDLQEIIDIAEIQIEEVLNYEFKEN